VAPLAQTVYIPLKQPAIPDASYRHKKFQIVSVSQHNHIFEEVQCPVNIQNEEYWSQVTPLKEPWNDIESIRTNSPPI
jgi:hypothetical protein